MTVKRSRLSVQLVLLFLGSLAAGCGPTGPTAAVDPPLAPWFRDVTDEVNLDFTHDAGPAGTYFMPQSMGSGAAFLDFNNDGLLDIYLLQCAGPDSKSTNRLYKQLPGGRFQDVSQGSGLDIAGYNTGVAVGDVNDDGWPDILVTQYGGLKMFLNNGDGTFTDVTATAGLDSLAWGTSASFVDYDRDGWLDLVVVNYIAYDSSRLCRGMHGERDFCHPREFPSTVARLYRNRGRGPGGKGVRFEDVTDKSGLGKTPGPGLGVLCTDFDGDGWPDIFVANDGEPNRLWINQHDGTFKDEALKRGLAYNDLGQAQAGMGVAWGDVDGDGLFDLFVTHLTEETHTLWMQGPRGDYRDRTVRAGLAAPPARGTGFGTVLADFDQDGALDVAFVHGRVYRGRRPAGAEMLGPFWAEYAEHNALLANDGKGHFRDLSASNPAFCATPNVGRGLVVGDVDGDGALDLLVTTVAGRARLYRNVTPDRGHWLLVRAIDPALSRDAYGAEVVVRAGERSRRRLVNPGSSTQCSNDPRAHFGLGRETRVDEIEVVWPDGTQETFAGRPADQVVPLRKGEGKSK